MSTLDCLHPIDAMNGMTLRTPPQGGLKELELKDPGHGRPG
jgi:hypothetical protein